MTTVALSIDGAIGVWRSLGVERVGVALVDGVGEHPGLGDGIVAVHRAHELQRGVAFHLLAEGRRQQLSVVVGCERVVGVEAVGVGLRTAVREVLHPVEEMDVAAAHQVAHGTRAGLQRRGQPVEGFQHLVLGVENVSQHSQRAHLLNAWRVEAAGLIKVAPQEPHGSLDQAIAAEVFRVHLGLSRHIGCAFEGMARVLLHWAEEQRTVGFNVFSWSQKS